jgi:hypothetical protein
MPSETFPKKTGDPETGNRIPETGKSLVFRIPIARFLISGFPFPVSHFRCARSLREKIDTPPERRS